MRSNRKRASRDRDEKKIKKKIKILKSVGDIILPKLVLGNPGKSSRDPFIASTAY